MDVHLLLAIQSACNAENIKLPWDKIGALVKETITGNATVQHLAKLRKLRERKGLPVPPPLRRGGVTAFSPVGTTNNTQTNVSIEDDEESFDIDETSDRDEDYGVSLSRHSQQGVPKEHLQGTTPADHTKTIEKKEKSKAKPKAVDKKRKRLQETEDSEDESEPATKSQVKRTKKRGDEAKGDDGISWKASSHSPENQQRTRGGNADKARGVQKHSMPHVSTSSKRGATRDKASVNYAKLSGESGDEFEDDEPIESYVAAGAGFLKRESSTDEDSNESQDEYDSQDEVEAETVNENQEKVSLSKIVKLNVGKSKQSLEFLRKLEDYSHVPESHKAPSKSESVSEIGQSREQTSMSGYELSLLPAFTPLNGSLVAPAARGDVQSYQSIGHPSWPVEQHLSVSDQHMGNNGIMEGLSTLSGYAQAEYLPSSYQANVFSTGGWASMSNSRTAGFNSGHSHERSADSSLISNYAPPRHQQQKTQNLGGSNLAINTYTPFRAATVADAYRNTSFYPETESSVESPLFRQFSNDEAERLFVHNPLSQSLPSSMNTPQEANQTEEAVDVGDSMLTPWMGDLDVNSATNENFHVDDPFDEAAEEMFNQFFNSSNDGSPPDLIADDQSPGDEAELGSDH
ncbi:hypothetical protein MMC20_005821 [Loxospora ochrophaea]|nr:hypothetical protein [Loxospora ochrophaea]